VQSRHLGYVNVVNHPDGPFNILTFPTHEAYQSNLSSMHHTFYMVNSKGLKQWNYKFRPLPGNHIMLDGPDNIPPDINIDLILSQNKFGQFQLAKKLADAMSIPLINIEHTLPMKSWTEKHTNMCNNMKGDVNVFITEFQRDKWGWPDPCEMISCCVNTTLFDMATLQRDNKIMTCVNDYVNRDELCGWTLFKQISQGFETAPVGETPGFSRPAESISDLITRYQTCGVFLNTSLWSTMPNSLLEAMSCGAPCVSTPHCGIDKIITHGENGFLYETAEEARGYVNQLLQDRELGIKLGKAARETMENHYDHYSHVEKWEQIIRKAVHMEHKS
jgi:hypothetical protein